MNNSRILTIKNAKFSWYYFYRNLTIWGDFQICISVPLSIMWNFCILRFCWVALLEILRNSLLTGAAGWQSTGTLLKTNCCPYFLKVFWKCCKISRNNFIMEFLFSRFQAYKQPSTLSSSLKILENFLDKI